MRTAIFASRRLLLADGELLRHVGVGARDDVDGDHLADIAGRFRAGFRSSFHRADVALHQHGDKARFKPQERLTPRGWARVD